MRFGRLVSCVLILCSRGARADDDGPVAATASGPAGLFRMATAEVGPPLSLRLGLHFGYFRQNSFLVAGGGGTAGDQDTRTLGDFAVGLTGPDLRVLRNFELSLGILSSENQNIRTDTGRHDPTSIATFAGVELGLKFAGEIAPGFSAGGLVAAHFYTFTTLGLADAGSGSIAATALGSFDASRRARFVPLRIHLSLGLIVDRSLDLLPAGECAGSNGNDACIRSRVVETFAYGIAPSRIQAALAVEIPLRLAAPWGRVGIAPLFEYHLERAVGDGDTVLGGALSQAPIPSWRIYNPNQAWFTAGVRLRPVAGLTVDVAADVGLLSPGFAYGPPVPAWNVLAGLGYALERGAAGPVEGERPERRLLGLGIAALVIGYAAALVTGLTFVGATAANGGGVSPASGALLIPVAGPFVSGALLPDPNWWIPWVFVDGLVQVAGLVMAIAGAKRPRRN